MAGPYVYTRDAYMTSDVMATVEVMVSLGTWHWPLGYAYMYAEFRVDSGEWIRVPAEELSLGIVCWWTGSTTELFSFNVPSGAGIVETRGAADAYYNVTHKYKETIYGTIRTLTVTSDPDTPWVATRSVHFSNETTISISAEGDPGGYTSAVLYMQYREVGGSSSDTSAHNITTLTSHSWDITVTPGVDYEARAALAYNSSIIYGEWYSTVDDVITDDGCIDPPSSGTGTLSDPYVIIDICQLNWIKTTPNAHYILGNDIDASQTIGWNRGAGFLPIGSSTGHYEPPTLTDPFTGSFNGQGYKIIGLHINRPTWDGAGLFGAVGTTGRISRVGIVNASITGRFNTGALVGTLYGDGWVSYCYSSGFVTGYGIRIGGLVGWLFGSKVTRSYSSCEVVGKGTAEEVAGTGAEIGGLVGDNDYGTISESYATGDVIAPNYNAGGLVGQIDGRDVAPFIKAVVINCYARGDVSGKTAGGLAASIVAESAADGDLGEAILKHSYSTGHVTGINIGGLVWSQRLSSFIDCFWDKETSGTSSSAGGTGETTANMKKESTFTSVSWDFVTLWDINPLINDGYPYFGESGDAVDIGQLIYLAVPSEKDGGGEAVIDHFSCYDVVLRDGQYSGDLVYLEDQFTGVWVIVQDPVIFGNPTQKVYGGSTINISKPDHHLVFYNLQTIDYKALHDDTFEWGSDGVDIDTSGGNITWTKSVAGSSTAKISTAQFVSGTRSFRLYHDGSNNASAYFSQTAGTGYSIKFWMRTDGDAQIGCQHGDGTKTIDLRVTINESFVYYYGSIPSSVIIANLNVDQWYEVEAKNINWDTYTYDIWLDGVEKVTYAKMRDISWAINQVKFSNFSGTSECWIDDVYVKSIDVVQDVAINNQLVPSTIKYGDDFEWGNDGDPIDDSGGDITWSKTGSPEIDTAQFVSGTRSLKLYYDGTNPYAYFSQTVGVGYSIKFWMRKDGNGQTVIQHGDGNKVIDLRHRNDEHFGYVHGDTYTFVSIKILNASTWHKVEILNINWDTYTYDVWVNNEEGATDIPMRNEAWQENKIRFGNAGSSACWIDDVLVTGDILISGPVMAAIPTKKGEHNEPENLDHFLVYDVNGGANPDTTVDLTDQFGTQSDIAVTIPKYFAIPAKKIHNGEEIAIVNSTAHLVIYAVSGVSPECVVNVVSQVTPEPPIIFTSDVTGLFVRGDEIQVIMSNLGFRSPDFGTNWYALNDLPTDGVVTVGFDANNPQNSFVGCDNEIYVFDNATGQKYNYVKSELGIISGMTTCIDVDLGGMGALGTDNALHKTLDFGHTTHLWLDEPVTDVSIGGSHVINPSCYFNPTAANDAELSKTDGDYSTAQNGTTGTVYNGDSTLIGQALSETSVYGIYRFGLAFDTTTLSGTIVSAGIRLYVNQVEDGASFNVVVQGDDTYPSNPVVASDYNRTHYSGDGGSVASSNILAETHLTIPLNSTGIGWINAGGYSRFIIRTDEDINGSAPSVNEYIKVNQSEKGSVHAPMLIVTLQTEL